MLFEQLAAFSHIVADILVIPGIVLLYKIKGDLKDMVAKLELRVSENYVKKVDLRDYVRLYTSAPATHHKRVVP